jgi:hypothetical protein
MFEVVIGIVIALVIVFLTIFLTLIAINIGLVRKLRSIIPQSPPHEALGSAPPRPTDRTPGGK